MNKLVLAFILLIASHMFAWQPSGWVYQMGDYKYEYQSGDWYWKMDWDYWNVNLSTGNWTNSSANGWNYYTWPYFYSTSLGQWRFASDPGSGADIVNLSTGSWSKFGQEAQTAFAPSSIADGTLIESSSSIIFVYDDNSYIEFSKDGMQHSVGNFYYTKTTPNTARLLYVSSFNIYAYSGFIEDYSNIVNVTFNSQNYFTTSTGGAGSIQEPQDLAPASIANKTVVTSGYEYSPSQAAYLNQKYNTSIPDTVYGTSINNLGATTYSRYDGSSSGTYTYTKTGPRRGVLTSVGTAYGFDESGDLVFSESTQSTAWCYFLTENTGHFTLISEIPSGGTSIGWGTFTLE